MVVVIGRGLGVFRSNRSARVLHQRCIDELKELLALIASRHLVLSHLVDSIPNRLDGLFERRRLERRLQLAEERLRAVDPDAPSRQALRGLEDGEQSLSEAVSDLMEALEATEHVAPVRALSGCLEGLEKRTREILDSVATYNAAAITYASFLSGSRLARRSFPGDFDVLDLEPVGSGTSNDSGIGGDTEIGEDRVAS